MNQAGNEVEARLVNTANALSRMGLIDARGHLSARLDVGRFAITPRADGQAPPPARLEPEDLVIVDLQSGGKIGGPWQPPLDLALPLALYRARSQVQAVAYFQPPTASAFAVAGQPLLPLTHTEAALALPTLPTFGHGELVDGEARATSFVDTLGDRPVALLPGQGAVAVGSGVAEAGMRCYQLELLARINALVAPFGASRTVAAEDSARISAQKAPPDDFQDYFDAVASGRHPSLAIPDPADGSEAGLRQRVAMASRLLYRHGLVEHLEHISVRLPDRSGFLMSPRKHLGQLEPEDLAVVSMDGDWVRGSLPPPPFLWFHRDVFAARPDVDAIVHTHQPVARALVMAGRPVRPLWRAGAEWVRERAPVYPVPDLMFGEAHRRAAIDLLGTARVLHEASHGTDFLSRSVEESAVAALQYERLARLEHLASQLGSPRPLPDSVLDRLAAEEPPPLAWWHHFLSEMPDDAD